MSSLPPLNVTMPTSKAVMPLLQDEKEIHHLSSVTVETMETAVAKNIYLYEENIC